MAHNTSNTSPEETTGHSLVCEMTPNSVKLVMLKLTSGILEDIVEGQKVYLGLIDRLVWINQGKGVDFRID